MFEDKRKNIDMMIEQFWKNGYMTVSRKFGTYLPEPKRMGQFDIDIIARYKKDYAIGIFLGGEELDSENIKGKLSFLASRQTKFSGKKVLLFVGVPEDLRGKAKYITGLLDESIRKNIKIFPIVDRELPKISQRREKNYFS